MLKELILKIITFTHVLFIMFVIVAPLTPSRYFQFLHAIIIPFIIAHWILNDNTCVLTLVERKLRGKEKEDNDCFTCRLIEPVYDFHKNYQLFSKGTYVAVIGLWLISVGKLACGSYSGELQSLEQLFVI
jgi:hypothetical protein